MPQICQVTGKSPMRGHHVSHAHNKTKRRFKPNLQSHTYLIPNTTIKVKLTVSTQGMRIIDKLGILAVLKKIKHPVIKTLKSNPL